MDLSAQVPSVYIHNNLGHDSFQHHPKRLTKLKKGGHRKERLETKLINQRIQEKGKGKAVYRELVGRSGTNSSTSIGVTSTSIASPPFLSLVYPTSATQSSSSSSTSVSTVSTTSPSSSSLASTSSLLLDSSSSNYSSMTSSTPSTSSLSISLISAPTSLKIFQAIKRPLKAAVAVDRGEILVETGTSIFNLAAAVDAAAGGGTLGSALSQAIATQSSTQGLVNVQQPPSSTVSIAQETSTTPTLSTIVIEASSSGVSSVSTLSITSTSIASIPSTLSSSASSILSGASSTASILTASTTSSTSLVAASPSTSTAS